MLETCPAKDHANLSRRVNQRRWKVEHRIDTVRARRLYFPVASNCNIALNHMTSKTGSALRTKHAPLARLLAFVLLAFVAYAATVETVHRHGNISLTRAGLSSTAVSNSSDAGSSLNEARSFSDCLICQLHQNLSTSLFSSLPQVVVPQAQILRTAAVEHSYLSQSDTPTRGRAPPTASL